VNEYDMIEFDIMIGTHDRGPSIDGFACKEVIRISSVIIERLPDVRQWWRAHEDDAEEPPNPHEALDPQLRERPDPSPQQSVWESAPTSSGKEDLTHEALARSRGP
jgi:hypothetical protein